MRPVPAIVIAAFLALGSESILAQETRPARPGGSQAKQRPQQRERNRDRQQREEREERERFTKQGVQVGQPVPDLKVFDLEGEEAPIASAWKDKPVLIVTASLTCPVAREKCPQLKPVIESFSEQLHVVVLYTIEAHPTGEDSPYRPGRGPWVGPANEREKILHPQPKSIEDRIALAQDMRDRLTLGESVTWLVDTMDNEAWKKLGGGPNMGLLIDTQGKVVAKHGWLDPKSMRESVEAMFKQAPGAGQRPANTEPPTTQPSVKGV